MNKFLLFSMPLLAGALVLGVVRVYSGAAKRTPDSLMKSVDEQLQAGGRKKPDYGKVLYQVELAMNLARERGDRVKEGEILKRRAEILNGMGRSALAREDYARLLAEFDPDNQITAITLSQLEYYADLLEPARARMEALLADDPDNLLANRTHGEILIKQADRIIADCEQVLQAVMDDATAERALRLTKWIAVRDEEDLRRAAMLEEVNSHFPATHETERKLYNQLVHNAGILYDNAYFDFEKALGVYTDLYVLIDLIELLHRSGRTADSIDFGLATERWFMVFDEPRPIQTLAAALHEADRSKHAAALVQRFSPKKLRSEFLPTWLPIAYAVEDWKELTVWGAAVARKHTWAPEPNPERSLALFYQGMGLSRTKPPLALGVLEAFANDPVRVDPFPGALSIAEGARAHSLLKIGGGRRGQAADPLLKSLLLREKSAGEEWLELLALVKSGHPDGEELELVLAHTMAALPERSDEFEPTWRQVAQERMDKTRLNLPALRRQSVAGETGLPPLEVGSYALFALAEVYAGEERWVGVYPACKAVLDLVPFFPPAVKLYVKACSRLGRPSDAIDLLLDQLRFLGENENVVARLATFRPAMSNGQLLEFMRLDPQRTGLDEMADAMIERGRSDRALGALEGRVGQLDPAGLFHYGRALAANGREQEALQVLARIPTRDPVYARAFEVLLNATIATGESEVLDKAIARLTLPDTPVGPELVSAVDQLLVARDLDTAQRISTYLDSSAETRSGKNLMRLAAVQLARGDFQIAAETLERAYAFQSDGGPELGHVLLAIFEDDANSLARALAVLEQTPSSRAKSTREDADPTSQIALALLGNRAETAASLQTRIDPSTQSSGTQFLLRVCADLIQGAPLESSLAALDPEIQAETVRFTTGTAAAPSDARVVLGYLLALQHPDWRLWLLQELRNRHEQHGTLWPSYLTALALLRHGEYEQADALIAAFTQRWPNFQPAWGLAVELVRTQPPSAERLLRFAIDGWTASASPEAARARQRLTRAREAFGQGDLATARSEIQEGLRIVPNDAPLLYQFFLLARAEGRYAEAVEATRAFLAALPARARDAALPTVLDLYEEALDEHKLSLEDWRRFVENVAERYPENSLVVLQLAHRDVRMSVANNPVTGVYRALGRLDAFRKSTNKAPVESLGAGSLARWHEFYLATSPERGEAFLREELAADPRSSDLWAMLGENLLAQGRCLEAREKLDLLLSIVPDERALELWIEIEARRGAPVEDLMRACTMLMSLRGLDEPDDRMRYLHALAQLGDLRGGDRKLGLEILDEVWQRSSELDLELATKVGRLLGVTSMSRGAPGDDQKAQAVFSALVELPLRRDQRRLYGALAHIGPAPARTKVAPKRPLPERIPTVAADGSEDAAEDAASGREARGGAQRKGKGGAAPPSEALDPARLEAMSPAERKALRAGLEESKRTSQEEPGVKALGKSDADERARFEAMSPEERKAFRAELEASKDSGPKEPPPKKSSSVEPQDHGSSKKALERAAFEAMTPAERAAYKQEPPPPSGKKKGERGG